MARGKDGAAKEPQQHEMPSVEALESELGRVEQGKRFRRAVRNIVAALLTVAAVAVLIATLVLPVLRIYGNSMTPKFEEGEVVVTVSGSSFKQGDVIAFYYNNKILVKRVICGPGDWFDMSEDGTVRVNGVELMEPYLVERAYGTCDIELPYQVPEGQYFVMGDHRSTSIDSRSTTVGCVSQEQVVGNIVFRVWPITRFGTV